MWSNAHETGVSYDALIVNTIPAWQCFPCAQYMNIGSVLLTVIVKVVIMLWFAATGTKPLLIALAIGWHGESKADCVTVWFLSWNWNSTVSPGFAVISCGVNRRREVLVEPTTTVWTFASAALGACVGTWSLLAGDSYNSDPQNLPPATRLAAIKAIAESWVKYMMFYLLASDWLLVCEK